VRRDGKWVVMPRNAALPPRCVKCNADADEPTKSRKLYWHHPGIYLLILASILIYIIVALVVRRSAEVAPGLCAEHKRKRFNGILISWLIVIAAFILPFALQSTDYVGAGVAISVLMFLGAILFGIARGRVVYAKRIDDEEVRLGGCKEDFLDSLPGY
jgi:hypothetical protein